jgi:WD40 repeat protein
VTDLYTINDILATVFRGSAGPPREDQIDTMSQDAMLITAKKEGSDESGDVVFLCHNSADKAFIRRIADALELDFGTRFFLDVFAIPTGEKFIPWIEKALEECMVCAIFLGGNGWGPTHLWEAELALARYRRDPTLRIIPVALPGLSAKEAEKLGSGSLFQEVNWADFTKGWGDKESLNKLEAALTGRKTLGYRGPALLTPYQVRRDAERWEDSGRKDSSILYAGKQLIEAEAMVRDNPDAVIVAGVASFLSASRQRQSGFWRRLAIGAVATAVVLLTATGLAISSYLVAEQRRVSSVSRQLAMTAKDAPGADRALLIGARAVLMDDTPEARGALLDQLQEFKFLKRIIESDAYVEAGALRADGDYLFGTDAGLRRIATNGSGSTRLNGRAASAAETVTAVAAAEGKVWLGREDGRVDALIGGITTKILDASQTVPPGRERRVRSLAYDGSRRLLAVGTGSGRIAVVRLSGGSMIANFDEGDGERIDSLSFDPVRPRLAVGTSGGTILLIDTVELKIVQRYPHVDGGVLSLGYLKDGSLAAVSAQGRLLYFDARKPQLERPSTGDVVPLATSAAFDAATSRVAVGDSSGTVRLYDAATGKGTGAEPLRGHSDKVTAIVFGAAKDDLATASANGTVALWDLAGKQGPVDELPQLNPAPSVIRADPSGLVIAASAEGDRADVRRLEDGEWKLVVDLIEASARADKASDYFRQPKKDARGFEELFPKVSAIAIDDAGTRVVWTTSGGAILSLPLVLATAAPSVVSPPGRSWSDNIAFSGDGKTVAVIGEDDGGLAVFRIDGSDVVPSTVTPPSAARSVTLNRDASRIAIGMKDGRIAQFMFANGIWKVAGEPWTAHASGVAGIMYSPNGRLIVSFGSGGGGGDRTVGLSNADGAPDPRILQARQAVGSVSSMSMGSASGILAAGDHGGQVLTWAGPETRYSGSLKASASEVPSLFIDDAHGRLLTSGGDGMFLSWPLDAARWVALACAKANRNFRRDEWRELLPDDRYVASCGQRNPSRR